MTVISYSDTCVTRHKNFGDSICSALSAEAERIGFKADEIPTIVWEQMIFSISQDPSNGEDCLNGRWENAQGSRIGGIIFNCDGSFFAEYDLLKPHPSDERWFVESVTAWGRENKVVTEPRLLAAV